MNNNAFATLNMLKLHFKIKIEVGVHPHVMSTHNVSFLSRVGAWYHLSLL